MYQRNALKEVIIWKCAAHRKPLVLRGARQTGKTTLVTLASSQFENVISLNLENSSDRRLWEGEPSPEQLLKNIEVLKNSKITAGKTLLFFDEIQEEPRAIASLRYFYEKFPDLHVIATGSLLEVALEEKGFSFPVGRVSFLYLYPVNFSEFLGALKRDALLEELTAVTHDSKIPEAIHTMALEAFYEYLYVGGMPEVVARYIEENSYLPLSRVKEDLIQAFEDDVPKYARKSQVPHMQLMIREAPLLAGQRMTYANFANSGYQSREMRMAADKLEQAMILQRIAGTHQTIPPLLPAHRVPPKILYLDVGLVGHRLALDPLSLKQGDVNDLFRGAIAEQVVGQEILAQNPLHREPPLFWYRNQPGATSEIDYCLNMKGLAIPVEVKSGKTGTLRSLLQFMEQAPHPYAVRIYSGQLQMDALQTPSGKEFQLLSVPLYLAFRLKEIIGSWMESFQTGSKIN